MGVIYMLDLTHTTVMLFIMVKSWSNGLDNDADKVVCFVSWLSSVGVEVTAAFFGRVIIAFGVLCRVGYVAVIYALTKMFGGDEPVPPSDSTAVTVEVRRTSVRS